jgi:hypothetical protein
MTKLGKVARREREKAARIANGSSVRAELARAIGHSFERAFAAARCASPRRHRTAALGVLALGLGVAGAVAVAKVTS